MLGAAAPAAAEWHLTPFVGVTLGGSTTFVSFEDLATDRRFGTAHRVFGASGGYVSAGPLGFEALLVYVPGIFDRKEVGSTVVIDSRSAALMGNVVAMLPRRWNQYGLRPFVSGGLGLLNVWQTNTQNALPLDRNVLGYNVGGGAVGPLSDRTGLRFDVRYISYVRAGETAGFSIGAERLSYWTASVGYMLRLRPDRAAAAR